MCVTGKGVCSCFNVYKQRFYGYPTKQMVQWFTLCQPSTGNIRYWTTNTIRRRCIFRCFPYVRFWNIRGRHHPLPWTRFLSLRVTHTSTKATRFDVEKPKYNVRQSSMLNKIVNTLIYYTYLFIYLYNNITTIIVLYYNYYTIVTN